ncbi:MAG: hypothetical protein LBO74_05240 [Candidatus Symbiothrix sp.]|jgi:hypothetical protein|nr:hypothetical protein [Candidatus Symbiothrix sp.]
MEERELKNYIEDMKAYYEEELNTREKFCAFLVRAGILDEKGDVTEPYRFTGNEDNEISYRYPSGRKINHHVFQEP